MIARIDGDLIHGADQHKWEYGKKAMEIEVPEDLMIKYYNAKGNEKIRKRFPDVDTFLKKHTIFDTEDLLDYLIRIDWLKGYIFLGWIDHEAKTKKKTKDADKTYGDKSKEYLYYMANNIAVEDFDLYAAKQMRSLFFTSFIIKNQLKNKKEMEEVLAETWKILKEHFADKSDALYEVFVCYEIFKEFMTKEIEMR